MIVISDKSLVRPRITIGLYRTFISYYLHYKKLFKSPYCFCHYKIPLNTTLNFVIENCINKHQRGKLNADDSLDYELDIQPCLPIKNLTAEGKN